MQVRFSGVETIPMSGNVIQKAGTTALSGEDNAGPFTTFLDADKDQLVITYDGPAGSQQDGVIASRAVQSLKAAMLAGYQKGKPVPPETKQMLETGMNQIKEHFLGKISQPATEARRRIGFQA